MHWEHSGYRGENYMSYLVHGDVDEVVEIDGKEKVTRLKENSYFIIRAQYRESGAVKWSRSLWVGQCVPTGPSVIFSLSSPVRLLLTVANHVERIKRYQFVLRRILMKGGSLATLDYARLDDYMFLELPVSYVVENLAP